MYNPVQDPPRAEDALDLLLVVDAVLEAEHRRLAPDQGTHLLSCRFGVVGLHTEQDQLDGADRGGIIGRLGAHMKIPRDALHVQTIPPDRGEMRAACDKCHVLPRSRQEAAEISPDPPASHHCNAHLRLL